MLLTAPGSVLQADYRKKPAGIKSAILKNPRPMLANSLSAPPTDNGWIHEIKYDGYRTLISISDEKATARTRNGHDWTHKYSSVSQEAAGLDCTTAIIDGEMIVQDSRGAASFQALQRALSDGRDQDLIFYAFDLLYLNGRDLTGSPLSARKELLRRLIPDSSEGRIQYSDHVSGNGRELFAQACRLGLEGVVSKRLDAPYRMSRSDEWIKSKRYDVGRFSVVGFTTKASDVHVASLILAEETGLIHAGRVSSGLTNNWSAGLFKQLGSISVAQPPPGLPTPKNATWIQPGRFTAEVAHRGRTNSGAVRQPSILAVTSTSPASPALPKRKLMTDRDLAAIQLTNPDREVIVGSGTTKLDIALYYARVGDQMLPYLLDRPVTLIRCTTGKIEDCFYQRHAMQGLPEGVEAVKDPKAKEFLVIRNARGLLGLTQFGAIEFHPWDCRADNLDKPDRFTIDLDPDEDLAWSSVAAAAISIRDRLCANGLKSFVRTTGGKGLHIVVPLARRQNWSRVKSYLKGLAVALASDSPNLFVTSSLKSHRVGRIFVDMGRTSRGSTATASFSLRARSNFPAAVPLEWAELQHFAIRPEFDRISAVFRVENKDVDPWEGFDEARTTITKGARRDVGLKD